MQTLQIDEKNARQLFPKADPAFKQMLTDTFGEKFFNQKITDRVKTFDDACEVLGIDPADVLHPAHSEYLKKDITSINAYCKLIIIARALNEGWTPDWSNSSQYKYVPWFKEKSGFGLSYLVCGGWSADASVGSRLCYKSSELAEYAGKQFEGIYKDYLTL